MCDILFVVQDPASLFPNYEKDNTLSRKLNTILEEDIGDIPSETKINGFNGKEAKNFIYELGQRPWLAFQLKTESNSIDIFKALFIKTGEEGEKISRLNKIIHDQTTTIQYILAEGNEVLLEWIHSYFVDKCDSETSTDKASKKCQFLSYCKLKFPNSSVIFEDIYLNFTTFQNLVNSILKNERPEEDAPSWWQDTRTSSSDLVDISKEYRVWKPICSVFEEGDEEDEDGEDEDFNVYRVFLCFVLFKLV